MGNGGCIASFRVCLFVYPILCDGDICRQGYGCGKKGFKGQEKSKGIMGSLTMLYQSHYEVLINQREQAIKRLEELNDQIRDLMREARAKKVIIVH